MFLRIFLLFLILITNQVNAQQAENKNAQSSKQDSLIKIAQSHSIMLNEVGINMVKNYKLDSLKRRQEYAAIFAYKSPGINDLFIKKSREMPTQYSAFQNSTSSIASLSVLPLIGLFTKNKSSEIKLKKKLLEEEDLRYIKHAFSNERITALTHLKGDSLTNFIQLYQPAVEEAKRMNDYEMLIYIKTSYQEFLKQQNP